VKITKVSANNRRKELSITTGTNATYSFPYAEASPRPCPENLVKAVFVDEELGNEAITYVLDSGDEGSVHIDQVLEYHRDPGYLAEMLTYKLTLEARNGIASCGLSRRQVARRLKTSVPQLYRLLDPANTNKSMSQLVTLLHVLDREVDLVVHPPRTNPQTPVQT